MASIACRDGIHKEFSKHFYLKYVSEFFWVLEKNMQMAFLFKAFILRKKSMFKYRLDKHDFESYRIKDIASTESYQFQTYFSF